MQSNETRSADVVVVKHGGPYLICLRGEKARELWPARRRRRRLVLGTSISERAESVAFMGLVHHAGRASE